MRHRDTSDLSPSVLLPALEREQRRNATLIAGAEAMKAEVAAVKAKYQEASRRAARAEAEAEESLRLLRARNAEKDAVIADLRAKLDAAERSGLEKDGVIARLTTDLAAVRRKATRNSRNSSMPPSSDLFKGAKAAAEKETGGAAKKKAGGQPGHVGSARGRMDPTEPPVDWWPAACSCGADLSGAKEVGVPQIRQSIDLPPPPPPMVTDHRLHACECPNCGKKVRAEVGGAARSTSPDDGVSAVRPAASDPVSTVPQDASARVRFGDSVAAQAAWLTARHMIAARRAAELLRTAHGLKLSAATIVALNRRAASRLAPFIGAVTALAKTAEVKCMDETGLRLGGKQAWAHIVATTKLTALVSAERGSVPLVVGGTVVHDGWKSYDTRLPDVRHAQCNAHILRYLLGADDDAKAAWANDVRDTLLRALVLAEKGRAMDPPQPVDPAEADDIRRRMAAFLDAGDAWHRSKPPYERPGAVGPNGGRRRGLHPDHATAVRLREKLDDILRFMSDASVPFTNNLAEQGFRMLKIRQKISGCFRDAGMLDAFLGLMTVIGTAGKQGWDPLETLRSDPLDLMGRLDAA